MLVVHHRSKRIALFLVIITEDGTSEQFHLTNDVPRLVVADVLHDILQDPLQHHISMGKVVNQTIDSLFLNLYVV